MKKCQRWTERKKPCCIPAAALLGQRRTSAVEYSKLSCSTELRSGELRRWMRYSTSLWFDVFWLNKTSKARFCVSESRDLFYPYNVVLSLAFLALERSVFEFLSLCYKTVEENLRACLPGRTQSAFSWPLSPCHQ